MNIPKDVEERLSLLGEELLSKFQGNKLSVALSLGYLPASIAWNVKSTYGLPLSIIADRARTKGLKMDWHGIEYEAAKEGADIRGEITEAQQESRMTGGAR